MSCVTEGEGVMLALKYVTSFMDVPNGILIGTYTRPTQQCRFE